LSAGDGSIIDSRIPGGNDTVGETINEYANSITPISDGFIVSSYVDNGDFKEAFIYRYDEDLAKISGLLWDLNFKQEASESGYDFIPVKVFQMSPTRFYTFCYSNTPLNGDNIPDYNFYVYVSSELNDQVNTLVLPGLDPELNERLTSVRAVPPQSGSGFIMAGYVSSPTSGLQELYALRVVQSLEFVQPSNINSILQGPPKIITTDLSPTTVTANASVFPSEGEGFLLLGNQNLGGNDNIYLTKVNNALDGAWSSPKTFGGAGSDLSGAVTETSDGRILLCGTMVLGDVIGQKKIVLINLSPNGLFGE
jgi:hypothetical protein